MSARTLSAGVIGLVGFALLSGGTVLGKQTGPKNPPLILRSVARRDLFEFYCATCHGRDGKGTGPAAGTLRVLPPDLTTLTTWNGGTFPKARVEALITRDEEMPSAHGSREIPIWGPIFRGLDPSDRLNRVCIGNIVGHLASIQSK